LRDAVFRVFLHTYLNSSGPGTRIRGLRITHTLESGEASIGGSVFEMFHLDYLSCFLTVLATILLARKCWIGLLLAIINSVIVCAIGVHTLQLGFIPANLFCICVYAVSMRSWFKQQTHAHPDQAQRRDTDSAAYGPWVHPAAADRVAAGTRRFPGDLTRSTATKTSVDGLSRPPLWRVRGYSTKTNNFEAAITPPAWRSKPSWLVTAAHARTTNPDR
jgi:hypothetical protein